MATLGKYFDAVIKKLAPYFVPSALIIYGMVLTLVWPALTVIGHQFADDVANPGSVTDSVLRTTVEGVVYMAFIALALIIGVILLGSVVVGIALVGYEVARLCIKLWASFRRMGRSTRPPKPTNVTPFIRPKRSDRPA